MLIILPIALSFNLGAIISFLADLAGELGYVGYAFFFCDGWIIIIPWLFEMTRWPVVAVSYTAIRTVMMHSRLPDHAIVCGLGDYGWPIV